MEKEKQVPTPCGCGQTEGGCRKEKPKEIGGPKGPEPTRYGDWERSGKCVDF